MGGTIHCPSAFNKESEHDMFFTPLRFEFSLVTPRVCIGTNLLARLMPCRETPVRSGILASMCGSLLPLRSFSTRFRGYQDLHALHGAPNRSPLDGLQPSTASCVEADAVCSGVRKFLPKGASMASASAGTGTGTTLPPGTAKVPSYGCFDSTVLLLCDYPEQEGKELQQKVAELGGKVTSRFRANQLPHVVVAETACSPTYRVS